MDYPFYLDQFQKAADQLDKKALKEKQLEVSVGITLDSVCLKLYKKQWTNDTADPLNATSRIFFSIWVNDKTTKEKKIYYNIHALKLRHLKGYSISSRDFAGQFRTHFKNFESKWETVSVNLGPLTLIEGWEKIDSENLEPVVANLAKNFLEIEHLVDKTLRAFETSTKK